MSDDGLRRLRNRIDEIDMKIVDLLNERANLALEIGKIKRKRGKEFYVPSREREVLERLVNYNSGPFPDAVLRVIYREIMSASLSLEHPLKVAFLGPDATFTHLACIEYFGSSAEMIPIKSISDVFDEVERGRADFGVVPVENSNEGMVTHTLDRFVDADVNICGEVLLEISYCLMSKNGRLEDVEKIYSHAQSIAQCRNWLASHTPDIPVMDVASTALAAQMAVEDDTVAAVASETAALMYDLRVIERRIEDNPNNITRFLVIGSRPPSRTGDDKTSILFSVRDEVGILYKMLEPFSRFGVNLTKIESRPLKKKAWEYIFFIDLEGHIEDEKVSKAIDALREKSLFLKILGSYPRMRMP